MTPDQTPALGWMAARASAAETVRAILVRDGDHTQARQPECADRMFKYAEELPAAIRALPAPTSAQLLAEAVKRPEVAALVDAHKEIIRQFGDTPNGHMAATISQSALASIKEAINADM